jgi:Malectin domain
LQTIVHRVDAERAEVGLLLTSRTFARTNNLGRFLSFICEKHFEGSTAEIKEYSIAVHALGRPPDFDPQLDTVVRVTAHNLRKRLELYYTTEGIDHLVQICLPAGHYIPQFVHREYAGAHIPRSNGNEATGLEILTEEAEADSSSFPQASSDPTSAKVNFRESFAANRQPHRRSLIVGILAGCVLATALYFLWTRRAQAKPATQSVSAPEALNLSGAPIRALVGDNRPSFADPAESPWQSDRFCSGGETFSVTGHSILGTNDTPIFASGRRGIFKCAFPAAPGIYEVHLLFAETSVLLENIRHIVFSINGGAPNNLDVVDDAGSPDTATTKIFTDVVPEKDGMIHIDFNSQDSFVNAIEIISGLPHRMVPARIVTGHATYRDAAGRLWLPDQYVFGGRLSRFGGDLSKVPDGGLYEWHRFGHFRYIIPVAVGSKYTVKLYFLEHWFGIQNGGVGGAGSRVFNVSCNGSILLKDFDIYREAGSGPLVKTFPHIEPTAQGKIELYFTPIVNYPSVSAIEITAE